MIYTLSEIARITDGELILPETTDNSAIRYLSFDSRTILSGKETLFFAIRSSRNDGHAYIADAIDREVESFVVSGIPEKIFTDRPISYIVVRDPLMALQQLAAFHRRRFGCTVTAITGSNGKTVVKEWLAELLGKQFHLVRSPRSYNSRIGVPVSVWLMDENSELAIFEAGISKPGEMERLEEILHPDHGIFTHLGNAHLENFPSVEALAEEKVKLFRHCSLLVYCRDFLPLRKAIAGLPNSQTRSLFDWSEKEVARLQITGKHISDNKTVLTAQFEGNKIYLEIPFTDNAHIENAIHCWAYLLATGNKPGTFEKGFLEHFAISMRLELKQGINGCAIIDDSYNSDTASLQNALDFLNQQNNDRKLQNHLILSDLLQSGKKPALLYREIAGYLRLGKINKLTGIGTEISKYADLFELPDKQFYPDTEAFLLHCRETDFRDELILLKGARNFRFDRISSFLQEKRHQTVMEINLTAMVHNLNHYRSLLLPGTKVMAMVKAFSYGTGSVEVARILQYHRIDWLAVAIADEGIALRNAGIRIPILVMNPEIHSFDAMIENGLEPNIYRYSLLQSFDEALRKSAVNNYPVHIKIDTGMKRLGFESAEEITVVMKYIWERDTMYIRSVFTHLAVSEDASKDTFTRRQFARFTAMSNLLTSGFNYRILHHILNTAGIERFPEMQLDMVRLGIGLYGSGSGLGERIRNVATLKSVISQIKNVLPGETVGYGRKFRAKALTRIAVIPIGYADGYSRRLGNGKGRVIINGLEAAVIGTVCMDMCMADVSDIDCREGDGVMLFGEGLPVSKVAEWMDTIPYEVLTTVGQRVKRVYFEE